MLTIEQVGPVVRVTLNRPDVRNAFNEALIAELTQALRALNVDPGVRVVVLAGRIEKVDGMLVRFEGGKSARVGRSTGRKRNWKKRGFRHGSLTCTH